MSMSRSASRLFSSSLRTQSRVNLSKAIRSPPASLARRMMSSGSHAGHGSSSSDTPWMIGSALVFGPLLLYLVSPSARKGSHGHSDAHHEHKSHQEEHEEKHTDVQPIADDEGVEVSGQEIKDSMERAFEADSPKDAQEKEVATAAPTAIGNDSASEAHPTEDSPADAPPVTESESNQAPPPAVVDDATEGTPDEKAQSTAGTEPTTESKD